MSKQLPPLPHQTILRTLHSEELPEPPYTVYGFTSEQLQAYATAATEPLLQRIAELERQLENARTQMEAQKNEWLSWEAKRKALEKQAKSYQQLRNGSNWPAVFESHDAPEPLRGEEIDAAMQKGQR